MTTPKGSIYSTSDTALAAWLYANGFELLEVDSSKFPSVFLFDDSSPKLSELAHDFQRGKANGNITVFHRAYKLMLSKIKDSRYGERK